MSNNISDATECVTQFTDEDPKKIHQEKGSKKKSSIHPIEDDFIVGNLHQDKPTSEHDSPSHVQYHRQQQQQLNDILFSQQDNFPDNNIQQIALQNAEYAKHANGHTPTTYNYHNASLLSSPFLDDIISESFNGSGCGCYSLDDGIPKKNEENVCNGNVAVSFTPQSLTRPPRSALSNCLNFTSPRRGFLTPLANTATDAFAVDDDKKTNPQVSLGSIFDDVGGQLSAPSGGIVNKATGPSFSLVDLDVDIPPVLEEELPIDDGALAAAASVDFEIDESSLHRAVDYTYGQNKQIYKLNEELIGSIMQMEKTDLSIEDIHQIKEDAKAETDMIIDEEIEHWNKQPDSLNKTNQIKYLQETAEFQKGKIDGILPFGLPILVFIFLCSTPWIQGWVDASNGGSARFGFDKCDSIIGLQHFIRTFSMMGLCQEQKVKATDKIAVCVRNARKCNLFGEEAEGHFKCQCYEYREQKLIGRILKPYLKAATKLGCQTFVVEAGGVKTKSYGVIEHAGIENISLLFGMIYHVQFYKNLLLNTSDRNSRALIQLSNMSDMVGQFSALTGREQEKSFLECFLSISLPNEDFHSLLARGILFKASKLKNPNSSGKKRKRKEVDGTKKRVATQKYCEQTEVFARMDAEEKEKRAKEEQAEKEKRRWQDNISNLLSLNKEKELADLKEKASPVYQKYVKKDSDIKRLGNKELEALVKYICKIENKGGHYQHCRNKTTMKNRLGECVPSWTSYFT